MRMTCKDCIYRAMCYKHEHFGRDDEETCEMFKNKADFAEVVRCKDCLYANDRGTICRYGVGREVKPDHFCGDGERRKDKEGIEQWQ